MAATLAEDGYVKAFGERTEPELARLRGKGGRGGRGGCWGEAAAHSRGGCPRRTALAGAPQGGNAAGDRRPRIHAQITRPRPRPCASGHA